MDFQEIDILLRIVIAHVIADFPLQSGKMAKEKKKGLSSKYFYYHILIVGVVTYFSLAEWTNWLGPLAITVAHGLIDLVKAHASSKMRWAKKSSQWIFIIDQGIHAITLIAYWMISRNVISDFDALLKYLDQKVLSNTDVLIIAVSYMIVTMPVGVLIGHATKKWQDEIEKDDREKRKSNPDKSFPERESLKDAGKTIGMIERSLVLTFILTQQYQAIGFLIAAKSVFRFGDLKEPGQRKRTEYILIGTLISFVLSILTGIFTLYLLSKF